MPTTVPLVSSSRSTVFKRLSLFFALALYPELEPELVASGTHRVKFFQSKSDGINEPVTGRTA